MTRKQLHERLEYWLDVLDAPEWKSRMSIRYGNRKEMGDNDGLCVWMAEYAMGEILVRRGQTDTEVEETIIHELLHLLLEGHRPEPQEYSTMYERGLNRITSALVLLESATEAA